MDGQMHQASIPGAPPVPLAGLSQSPGRRETPALPFQVTALRRVRPGLTPQAAELGPAQRAAFAGRACAVCGCH